MAGAFGAILAALLLPVFGTAAHAQDDPARAAEVHDHQACMMLVAYVEDGIEDSRQMAVWRRACDHSTNEHLRAMTCALLKKRNVSTAGMRCGPHP